MAEYSDRSPSHYDPADLDYDTSQGAGEKADNRIGLLVVLFRPLAHRGEFREWMRFHTNTHTEVSGVK